MNQHQTFNEHQWLIQIRHFLEENLGDDDDNISVSIAAVPKPLMQTKPESYTPQLISIGPYHQANEELHEMERYKLSAAKSFHKSFHFTNIVNLFISLSPAIRAHYHRYLNITSETLAWMMVIDAAFLIEFLRVYGCNTDGKNLRRIPSKLSHLVDFNGQKSMHNMVLRDLIMFENQIPLILARKSLEIHCSSLRIGDEMLQAMLIGLFKELSPFKNMEITKKSIDMDNYSHMLEFFYRMIVPKCKEESDQAVESIEHNEENINREGFSRKIRNISCAIGSFVRQRWKAFVLIVTKFFIKIPWRILSNLPIFAVIKQPVEDLFTRIDEISHDKALNNNNLDANAPPLTEEISIPSVTELTNAGITVTPTSGSISSIEFDPKNTSIQLPAITVDVNSEVLLRNLVAFETSIVSGPLSLTRYIELMNGIIDNGDDVKILREAGVLFNRMKSDREVAELWNGMSRSVRLTRVSNLDSVIKEINNYYYMSRRVKLRRFVKKFVVDSWQVFVLLVVVAVVMVINFQVLAFGLRFIGVPKK